MIIHAVNLAAAVALLLWSVRLIRTGVERAFLTELRRELKSLSQRRLSAAIGGTLAAMLLQSSTAVALIGGGFTASGMLTPPAALAMMLGADLGSALMAQVLLLPVAAAIPFVLLGGVVLFLNARSRKTKQIGRIIIGFALVLMALSMIRQATAPIGQNALVAEVLAYFEADLISAFAIGALLAWAMHSSLAAVLTFATFATTGIIAVPVAAALVLGANLGGAATPVMLLSTAPRSARLVASANLLTRGGATVAVLIMLVTGLLDLSLFERTPWFSAPAQQAVMLHLAVNVLALVVALPLVGMLIALAARVVRPDPDTHLLVMSALDPDALDRPQLAIACAQRELLHMAETVQAMLMPVIGLFRHWSPDVASRILRLEDDVDRMHFETKIYVSQLRESELPRRQARQDIELVAIANSLEEAADRIAVNLLALARKMHDAGLSFSREGLADIEHLHDQVVTNTQLALSVLTMGDAEAARQVVAGKDRIRREEKALQERHLKRLQEGDEASIETTNIHQETLRLLKQINAALSYIAYPIAQETGDLLDSRLAPTGVGAAPR